MQHHVIVSFGKEKEFEFKFPGGQSPEDARKWFRSRIYWFLSAMSQRQPGKSWLWTAF